MKGAQVWRRPLPQITKLPKKSQNNGFKICDSDDSRTRHIAPRLNEVNILSPGNDLRGNYIDPKTNPNLSSKPLPLKTTINILIIISYIIEHQLP